MKTSASRLLWLFGTHFYISAFTFGGGYVIIPMIRKAFVGKKNLFDEKELLDMAAVAQSVPGAIAVNMAVLTGYRTAGRLVAAVSCAASVLPPLLILSLISFGYQAFRDNAVVAAVLHGMQAGVAALILDLLIGMCGTVYREQGRFLFLLAPAVFAATFFFNVPIYILLPAAAALAVGAAWLKNRRHGA